MRDQRCATKLHGVLACFSRAWLHRFRVVNDCCRLMTYQLRDHWVLRSKLSLRSFSSHSVIIDSKSRYAVFECFSFYDWCESTSQYITTGNTAQECSYSHCVVDDVEYKDQFHLLV
ncbi:MAG: hypothetical protein ACI9BW_001594 [Gammaproteobacteria bacterium]|jgi:hypothetical protein